MRHHGAGALSDAAEIYREILQREPDNPFALHLLGVTEHQQGKSHSALELIQRAIAHKPEYADAHCNLGLVHKALGQLDDAIASYRRAIALSPDYAQAHNNLGNALQEMDLLDAAAESYERALLCDPDYINALCNLGFVLKKLGRLSDAIARCRQALALDPDNVDAHSNLGLALQEQGELDAAIVHYRHAVALSPDDADAHNNLGNALQELDSHEDAIASYRRAIALVPDYFDALNNLGNALHEMERYDEAAERYRQALTLNPESADAHNNLGLLFQDQGRYEAAVASYRRALAVDADAADAHGNLGVALNALGNRSEAIEHFSRHLVLTRSAHSARADDNRFRFISRAKIDHDIEQFRYLEGRSYEAERFGKLAEIYERLRDEIDWPAGDPFLVPLTDAQYRLVADSYNRPVHQSDALEVPGSALGEDIDADEITRQYFGNGPGMTFCDNVLSPPALVALRRYLLESTIWFDFKYRGGYLGAFLNDGLACPLVLQIAEDFRRTFPDIFKDHALRQCWAYKYDSRLRGIDVHADTAAVNVNFWVTPSSANLNRDSGGLVVYKTEAPLDWRFNAFNKDQRRIRRYLAENDEGKMVVPYAENRAVLFNSDLFHETDTIDFKSGYENRRINVTMLFGRRQD